MIQLVWRDVRPAPDGPPISTSVTEAESAELRRLADGARVLEVGSAYGYSAVVLALGGADHVTAVDAHTWLPSFDTMQLNLAAYGVADRVTIDPRLSFDALPDLAAQGHTFDLIFVDGDHAEPTVEFDVSWARKLLAAGGVLACHDWDEATCPGVRAALERLLGPPPRLVDTLAVYTGLA